MKKVAFLLSIFVFIFGAFVAAGEEVKVPFSAVKTSYYEQIDMSKAEFLLSEIGKDCVIESWLEENLSEKESQVEETKATNKDEEEPSNSSELEKNVKQVFYDVMGKTVNWENKPETIKEFD
ncbi:MAG: hypothetical protein ACLFVS_03255 [Candidatus Acetothermia bacterium]